MKWIFITLLSGLLVKDIVPLGDRYVLRGVSEGLALVVGLRWFISHPLSGLAKRQALVFLYLATVMLTAFVSQRPFFVILQVMSLAAVTLFFIAYVESSATKYDTSCWNIRAVTIAFTLTCVASLTLLISRPHLAFEITPEGNRFRGVFNEPAMMGAVSGILVGLATFGRLNWLIRMTALLAAVPCLYLTGSRTSWVAAVAALLITGFMYIKQKRCWTLGLAFVGIVGGLGVIIADFHITSETQSRTMRSASIDTLSGRTVLWKLALTKYQDSPILGYGFTTGSDALSTDMEPTLSEAFGVADATKQQLFSLHSGYIQALLDSGAIGVTLYVAVLGSALWRLLRHDHERRYGGEMYGLVFFSVSNVGDTIIFGAAVFYEVFYWYVAILALSIVEPVRESLAETFSPVRDNHSTVTSSQPNFSGKNDSSRTPIANRHFPLLQD